MSATASLLLLAAPALAPAPGSQDGSYVHFDSGPVHPIRVSDDGTLLLVTNTPDGRLSVYDLRKPQAPIHLRDIPVGLEPVSVTPRTDDEVWVANTLSDSVSVVSVREGRVIDVLRVPDEPADVAFAGDPPRAFVTASASDEVRVFDAETRAPLATVPIFGRDPRALVADAGGERVFVLVLRSGNRSTVVGVDDAPPPPAPTNPSLPPAPKQALIVRDTDAEWQGMVSAELVDNDVVEIDASSLTIASVVRNVGTILYDVAYHAPSNSLFVAGSEARNLERFEPTLAGRAIESRVSRVDAANHAVFPLDLNPGLEHLDLQGPAAIAQQGPASVAQALAEPTGVVVHPGDGRVFVAAQGTDRVGVLSPSGELIARVEVGATPGSTVDTPAKRGPRALALHPSEPYLYVFNRLSLSITIVETAGYTVVAELPLSHDPTPEAVKIGRRFLYDAKLSSHGLMSCAACHVDGEWDGLAWDLGDPGGEPDPAPVGQPAPFDAGLMDFHPLKGPMTTQTLRGLEGQGPYHWRGDRPELEDFQRGFTGLLGADPLAPESMERFVAFLEALALPPNPNQNLDRSLPDEPAGANAAAGAQFFEVPTKVIGGQLMSCATCHSLPSGGSELVVPPPLLESSTDSDQFKVPQLRTIYRKENPANAGGYRKLGFGLLHNGVMQDLETFFEAKLFDAWPDDQKDDLAAFMRSFDTGTAPIVGYQVRTDATNAADPSVVADVLLLEEQVEVGNADAVAKGFLFGLPRGMVYDPALGAWRVDDPSLGPYQRTELQSLALAGDAELVFTGVPPGTGERIGIDRDADGIPDGLDSPRFYGHASPGCDGDPQLYVTGTGALGSKVTVSASRIGASSAGLFVASFLEAEHSALGVDLLADPLAPGTSLIPAVLDPSGFAANEVAVPAAPGLSGATVFIQGVFTDPCGPKGWAATWGVQLELE